MSVNLGECLQKARKQRGFSQQQLADELGVSRQTISKWELNETQPDLSQARKLAEALHLSLDELTHYDPQLREIEQVIEKTSEKKQNEINWTQVWAKKYPVLASYPSVVDTAPYTTGLQQMLDTLQRDYHYNDQDAFLVLKDILAQIWNQKKKHRQSQ